MTPRDHVEYRFNAGQDPLISDITHAILDSVIIWSSEQNEHLVDEDEFLQGPVSDLSDPEFARFNCDTLLKNGRIDGFANGARVIHGSVRSDSTVQWFFTPKVKHCIILDARRKQVINSRVQVDQTNSRIMFDNIDILNDDSLTLMEISSWVKERQFQLCNHNQWNRRFTVESDGTTNHIDINVKFEPDTVSIIAVEFNGVDIMPRKTGKPELVEIPEP